jgi:hypothetical protein
MVFLMTLASFRILYIEYVGFVTKAVIPGRVVSRFHARHGGSIK